MYLVYKTDSHHSYTSRDIIGLATSGETAIQICIAQAKKEGHTIKGNPLHCLTTFNQTQGYKGEGEFQFENIAVNTLL